ncbi:hypothetical protein BD560DRAFT_404356 [Blakeslea trispora]|nr:hypothetical protein BD560DRAFT_404356 [Blakeslea trispora]
MSQSKALLLKVSVSRAKSLPSWCRVLCLYLLAFFDFFTRCLYCREAFPVHYAYKTVINCTRSRLYAAVQVQAIL